jgi:hypothetical protein
MFLSCILVTRQQHILSFLSINFQTNLLAILTSEGLGSGINIYFQEMREGVLPPIQNIVRICKQVTIHILN